jgi:hypothetical protein
VAVLHAAAEAALLAEAVVVAPVAAAAVLLAAVAVVVAPVAVAVEAAAAKAANWNRRYRVREGAA